MKSASFNDLCRVCGATIPDNGGSLDYRCDECVAAGRTEPKPSPATKTQEEQAADYEWGMAIAVAMSDYRKRGGR